MKFDQLLTTTPLGLLDQDAGMLLPPGGLGAIIARAGVGKTAFLVQLAIYQLMKNNSVIHFGIQDTVKKMCLWYEEIRRNIHNTFGLEIHDADWDSLLKQRFLISHKLETFSLAKLEAQLTDLIEQAIFIPRVIIIDGLELNHSAFGFLTNLQKTLTRLNLRAWLSFRSELPPPKEGEDLPDLIKELVTACDCTFLLRLAEAAMRIDVVKCGEANAMERKFLLDPTNLLLTKC